MFLTILLLDKGTYLYGHLAHMLLTFRLTNSLLDYDTEKQYAGTKVVQFPSNSMYKYRNNLILHILSNHDVYWYIYLSLINVYLAPVLP